MAIKSDRTLGESLLRQAHAGQSRLLWAVGIFSVFTNLLQLTGAVYMLQVYDRVLASRSEPTLVALSGLATGLFIALALLDHARARITTRMGAKLQDRLDRRVFAVALRSLMLWPDDAAARAAQSDLEAVQRLWASPVVLAIFDVPWIPLFFLLIFAFHPLLGLLALGGGATLIVLTSLTQQLAKQPLAETNAQAIAAERMADQIKAEVETVQATGMTQASFDRWQKLRQAGLVASLAAGDRIGLFGTLSRSFRLFLQSAMLGLGAWLVLQNQLSAGAMIATSILLGRALAPIEQAIGQWATVSRAQEGWARLALLLSRLPEQPARTALPAPKGWLKVDNLTVFPPSQTQASLRAVSFELHPGQALGVIGASGAGKSSLARALISAWRPAGGHIRLGGASLDHYDPEVLGSYIGHLPQRVGLFDGTIAENIARLRSGVDAEKIIAAAQKAAAHEMILRLPQGYDTRISPSGSGLSGGQIQRIGLARAVFGDPVLLVLDEPNSNLDNDGTHALNLAIRATKAAGGAVIIMAHRPAAIQECEQLLMLENGLCRGFGPRDAVLRSLVKNQTQIIASADLGGGGMTKSLPAALSARKSVIIGLLTLGLLVGGFGGWSYFAKIDSAIIALGQVEVERNKQIVQHPEGGVVAEIAVKEAQTVSAGDVLIRLDSTVLQSELDLVEAQLYSSIARRDRLNSELADKATPLFSAILNRLSSKRPELAEQIADQIALFHSRKASLLRQSAQLGKRQHQITLQTKGLTAQFAATKRQLSYINADLAVKIKLQSQGLVQSSPVLALQREAARLQGDLATLTTAQAVATERAIEVTLEALRLREIRQEAISAELQDLNPKIATLAERQTQLTDQITKLAVRAPVSGVILGLQVTAPRAVLRAAEPILYIVPQDRPLIVSVNIPPLHRDETHVGQQVRLVFPSFSARNMPSIFGHLTGLSADALIDPRSQLAYYRADIAIDTDQMAKLATTPLLPGMPVEAFIETGAQAPITYLLKPITDYFAKAMRES